MHNRAEVVDKNFTRLIRDGRLPEPRVRVSASEAVICREDVIDLFETQVISRHLDLTARLLKAKGESYYTIGSSGHEGNAVFGKVFRTTDMAFLHYRSGAFFIQRGKRHPGSTPIYDVLLSLTAAKDDPISGGRHKVFGSVPLNIPPQTSTIASHLPKAVGASLSIRRARDLEMEDAPLDYDSIVLCSFGDASFNHASALSALNTAQWCAFQRIPVPLVLICEDNGIGISVPTPGGWIQASVSKRPGLRYFRCDGRHLLDVYRTAMAVERFVRQTRKPAFLHMETVRLLGHAGSDVESLYHAPSKIQSTEFDDPLLHSARILLEHGFMGKEQILDLYESVRERVNRAAEYAARAPKLETPDEVASSIVPDRVIQGGRPRKAPPLPANKSRQRLFGTDWRYMDRPQHMAKLLNWGLTDLLLQYNNILVFGEDVAQKGGVYHVTVGLFKKFGLRRVFNSPLDETNILGTAIGMAHNGFLPIPEIQFLAYVHNSEDQLRGEAATLSFFSKGQYTNPMVIRIAGLAYQKGFGGHFHNDNSLAVFRDIPGVIIACPSRGDDAVKMLRTCVRLAHEQGRVVVFIEPIALYMTKDLLEDGDGGWACLYPEPGAEISLGELGVHGHGRDLAIVTYGNGTYLSRQAASTLESEYGIGTKVIDLRWLAPLSGEAILKELKDVPNVLIVDECRRTGSQSEALVTLLVEGMEPLPKIRRVTAEDCFIPLGKAATAPLPSRESILRSALELVRGPDTESLTLKRNY